MQKKTFVTLCPLESNNLLVKDIGQIPYTMGKLYGYDAYYANADINLNGDYIDDISDGMKIDKFPKWTKNWKINGLIYILKNGKKIDWLNIYFAGHNSYLWSKAYKLVNPKGHVYVKLDMDYRYCEKIDKDENKRKWFVKCVEYADLVSVESEPVLNRIMKYTKKDIKFIPNGSYIYTDFDPSKKGNMFLTVGRLGTKQKATEILLQAFAKSAKQHNWSLTLVGPIQDDFKPYIEKFTSEHEELKTRIHFTGNITTRQEISEYYKKAKVFVLPSRWEGYALVLPEAVSNGCFVITTNGVPSAQYLTDNGKYAEIVDIDDVDALSKALIDAAKINYSVELYEKIAEYGKQVSSWEDICGNLNKYMLECEGQ